MKHNLRNIPFFSDLDDGVLDAISRRLQREHQVVPGQVQVAGLGPVAVQHGWHLALAAAAAGSALAELGASLGGDLDLGHGAYS